MPMDARTVTAADAAYQVLKEAGKPLHSREIVHRILTAGLWTTTGKTPWATVSKDIQVDIKRNGAHSRFRQTAPAKFTVADTPALFPDLAKSAGEAGLGGALTVPGDQMSFLDAAVHVLQNLREGERMLHYREITKRAIAAQLIHTKGKTPESTMAATIGTDIRRREERGERQRFVREGRGMIGLIKELPIGVAAQIRKHNAKAREELLKRAKKGTPGEFEELVETLLVAMGFEEVERTPMGRDGGVDVRGTLVIGDVVRIRMAVQAKRWQANVQRPMVQQVRGALGANEQGLIITTGKFSKGAHKEAERSGAPPVALMDGEQLAHLLARHQVGAVRQEYVLVTVDSDEPSSKRLRPGNAYRQR